MPFLKDTAYIIYIYKWYLKDHIIITLEKN